MTAKEYVIESCRIKGLALMKPTKSSPEIVAHDFNKKNSMGVFPCVIDAQSWAEARDQLIAYYKL